MVPPVRVIFKVSRNKKIFCNFSFQALLHAKETYSTYLKGASFDQIKNRNFCQKTDFFFQKSKSVKNRNFGQKSKSVKNRNFGQKSKFRSKIEIFVKNGNFCQQSKLLAQIDVAQTSCLLDINEKVFLM